jgi:hypothetical protein
MKNFSEATVIKSDLMLDVNLVLSPMGGATYCQIELNQKVLFVGLVSEKIILNAKVPLCDPLHFKFFVERTHPQAIHIDLLTVDSREVLPLYRQHASPPTSYLDFTGHWELSIPNFYTWYHEITGQGWIA